MYDLDDEIEQEPEEYDEDSYDDRMDEDEEETLEELDIDERGHVIPRRSRRRRQDEESEFQGFDDK